MVNTNPSLKTAFTERRAAQRVTPRLEADKRKANQRWDAYVAGMASRIPATMMAFARKHLWIDGQKQEVGPMLGPFLIWMGYDGVEGKDKLEWITQADVLSFGFKGFDDLRAGLKQLEEAWEGIIGIDFDSDSVVIQYTATEYKAQEST